MCCGIAVGVVPVGGPIALVCCSEPGVFYCLWIGDPGNEAHHGYVGILDVELGNRME